MYITADGKREYDIGDEVEVSFKGLVTKKESLGGEFWYQVDSLPGSCAVARRLEASEIYPLPQPEEEKT